MKGSAIHYRGVIVEALFHRFIVVLFSSFSIIALSSSPSYAGKIGDLRFESGVPENVKTQMIADLGFMAQVVSSGTTPLHRQIFGEVNGASYEDWFTRRIKRIGLNSCGSPKAVACVIPFLGSDRFFITRNYIDFDHPTIARLMVVYHEARHTETQNGNWSHAQCPTPFRDANGKDYQSIWTGASLAGEAACDVTALGSYGSSTILLRNISQACTNCTEKTRLDAQLYADDQLNRVVDAASHEQISKDLL